MTSDWQKKENTSDEEDIIFRPISSRKFTNSMTFIARDNANNKLNEDAYAWIVKNYIENYGLKITRRNLYQGLMKEIALHEENALIKQIEESAILNQILIERCLLV